MNDHVLMGRLCGAFNPATKQFTTIDVCSCGHSFYGASVDEADNRFQVHKDQAG